MHVLINKLRISICFVEETINASEFFQHPDCSHNNYVYMHLLPTEKNINILRKVFEIETLCKNNLKSQPHPLFSLTSSDIDFKYIC